MKLAEVLLGHNILKWQNTNGYKSIWQSSNYLSPFCSNLSVQLYVTSKEEAKVYKYDMSTVIYESGQIYESGKQQK